MPGKTQEQLDAEREAREEAAFRKAQKKWSVIKKYKPSPKPKKTKVHPAYAKVMKGKTPTASESSLPSPMKTSPWVKVFVGLKKPSSGPGFNKGREGIESLRRTAKTLSAVSALAREKGIGAEVRASAKEATESLRNRITGAASAARKNWLRNRGNSAARVRESWVTRRKKYGRSGRGAGGKKKKGGKKR